jgi:hypothetical protein
MTRFLPLYSFGSFSKSALAKMLSSRRRGESEARLVCLAIPGAFPLREAAFESKENRKLAGLLFSLLERGFAVAPSDLLASAPARYRAFGCELGALAL